MKRTVYIYIAVLAGFVAFGFQNCSKVDFAEMDKKPSSLGVCDGISCDLTPLTSKTAVTTILMAVGDEAENQLVANGASTQLIAETVVRYTSPKTNPKILLVVDENVAGEDPEDTTYVANVLLGRYDTTVLDLGQRLTKLSAQDLEGYDVVWFNNPGHPMGSVESRDALLNFKGGVILQGDDLSNGAGFNLEELTGLKYLDNGTSVTCGTNTYNIDNDASERYIATLDTTKIPGADSSTISFEYGNDIDNTTVLRPDLEVLAWAKGRPSDCVDQRPAIVRYLKDN